MSPTFKALNHPNYRLWLAGSVVSNVGTWMQRVAQDWLVLTVLTDNSGVAVGITTGLQFAPMLLFAPFAGSVVDRFSRRRILIGTQVGMGLLAALLGVLVVTDMAQLWMVYALAFGLGTVAALDGPARQTFVSELVPREDLPNAVGLNSASFNGGRLIGPAVAGLLIHWLGGTGPVFLINAVSFAAVVIQLSRMDLDRLLLSPNASRKRGSVRDGLAYVRHRSDILLLLGIVGMIGTFTMNFQVTTALMARLVFDKGSGQYGLLGSVMAIGSLSGALLAARRSKPSIHLVAGAAVALGVSALVASVMPTYWSFAVLLVPVGLSALTVMTAANATVQLSVAPELRGRVMALYMAIFMGGTPIGAPIIGWIGETFGARWTIGFGGLTSLLTAAVALTLLRSGRVPDPQQVVDDVDPAAAAVPSGEVPVDLEPALTTDAQVSPRVSSSPR
ncbi:MFS transporter [Spongisporangium articulatum]|uniref:MFS transporter n=1 Tax=Spongisporangium articulatum TaxID=3362603 RepID=A0ABW8AH14_9ACTN